MLLKRQSQKNSITKLTKSTLHIKVAIQVCSTDWLLFWFCCKKSLLFLVAATTAIIVTLLSQEGNKNSWKLINEAIFQPKKHCEKIYCVTLSSKKKMTHKIVEISGVCLSEDNVRLRLTPTLTSAFVVLATLSHFALRLRRAWDFLTHFVASFNGVRQ